MAIGFTLHASAFLGEIWRGSIEAVPRGQTEAAKALGLQLRLADEEVILPQALRISLPATVGFLVQLIKGTSLAAIVGFTELARAGSIVSNQNFKPLLVFGVVGIFISPCAGRFHCIAVASSASSLSASDSCANPLMRPAR